MQKVNYYIFRFFIGIFSIFSFWQLYVFSDILCFFIYRVAGYRKKIVFENLRNSFPEKQEDEISMIANGFYHHLTDVITESMKAFSMPEETVIQRYRYIGMDALNALFRQNQSVICVAGHFNNWEWGGIASDQQMLHTPVGFYQPLSNKYTDAYVRRRRVRGKSKLASVLRTSETFRQYLGSPHIFYMIADQSPSSPRLSYWVNFLNQDTATLHGPEKYARLYNYPVFYADVQKVKRGYYTVSFIPLTLDPSSTQHGEITGMFMHKLEEKIRENPSSYLWSHRRWKLKR